jgi:arsenate reductase
MIDEPTTVSVLFLCVDNAVRSVMAEAIMNRDGRGLFRAYSAGSYPAGEVSPHTLSLLRRLHYAIGEFHPRPWAEFAGPGAPNLDFVIILDREAAEELWPEWPGHPMTVLWPMPDPAMATGASADVANAFADAYKTLSSRIERFMNLPLASFDRLPLQRRLNSIGCVSEFRLG